MFTRSSSQKSNPGLEPRTSRPQTGLLLTRLGLALDRRAAEMRPGHAAKFVKLIGEQQASP